MVTEAPTKPPQPASEFEARVIAAKHGSQRTYAKAVHNLDYEPYQDAWVEALETMNRVVIVCPPDTYKSTTVQHFIERQLGKDRNTRILWLMNAGDQAMKRVMTVKQTIQSNNIYKAAFDVAEDTEAQWTNSVLFVLRDLTAADPSLMGAGLNGPYQGLHFNIIVIDDPTDQEDVRSPATMELQEQKIRGVVLDRLLEGGRIVVILTRWGENDLVPVFASMGFEIIEMPVVGEYPWGPTLSPQRFSPQRVEELHRDKRDDLFNLTYMCDTRAAKGNIIKRDHIQFYDPREVDFGHLYFFMGIDPAATEKTYSDYSAISVVGLDIRTKDLYLAGCWAGRVEVPELERRIIQATTRTAGLLGVGLETVAFQVSLLQRLRMRHPTLFQELPYRTRRTVMNRAVALDRSKVGRALYLDSLFAEGRLKLPSNEPFLLDGISLMSELCRFNGVSNVPDDRMDSISFACVLAENAMPVMPTVRVRAGA